jgi:hypothetical protein
MTVSDAVRKNQGISKGIRHALVLAPLNCYSDGLSIR